MAGGRLVIFAAAKKVAAAAQDKREARGDLQFWRADLAEGSDDVMEDLEVHFPSMLMRKDFRSLQWSPHSHDSFRLFHVQRKGDGTWESKMTLESWKMEEDLCRYLASVRASVSDQSSLEKFLQDSNDWKPIAPELAGLETAFQRFIHAPDIVDTDAGAMWRKQEGEEAKEEEARRLHERGADSAVVK